MALKEEREGRGSWGKSHIAKVLCWLLYFCFSFIESSHLIFSCSAHLKKTKLKLKEANLHTLHG